MMDTLSSAAAASTASTAVIETLMRACSQDTSVLKPAESLLKQWETQPGFYSILAVCDSVHHLSHFAQQLLC